MAANAEQKLASSRRRTYELNNIAPIPRRKGGAIAKWKRLRDDPAEFLRLMFPLSSGLKPFGPAQRDAINRASEVMRNGGQLTIALPRRFAKTTTVVGLSVWAVLYGFQRFVLIVSSSKSKADEIFNGIKTELESNDHLLKLFPEACYPIRELGGAHQRTASQHVDGELTMMQFKNSVLRLPMIRDSDSRGSIIKSVPLGSSLGMQARTPTGEVLRPTLVLMDDVQTDDDSRSPELVEKLEQRIESDLMMTGDISKTQAAVMTCTVRRPNDLSCRYLQKWNSAKYSFFLERPEKRHPLWNEYIRLRMTFDSYDPQGKASAIEAANDLYRQNQSDMDYGYVAAWDWAFRWADGSERTPVQHYFNEVAERGEETAASELDNDGSLRAASQGMQLLSVDELQRKQHPDALGIVPVGCHSIAIGADIQSECVYYVVAAFGDQFTGGIIDYGVYPQQPSRHLAYKDIEAKLSHQFPNAGTPGRIHSGITALAEQLFTFGYRTESGTEIVPSIMLVDRGYETDAVDSACRSSPYNLIPAAGVGIKAGREPMASWPVHPGTRAGHHWQIRPTKSGSNQQFAFNDVNYWKTMLHRGLSTTFGDPSCLSLFHSHDPVYHRTIANQFRSESATNTEGRGRKLTEWSPLPGKPDNHLFDAAVLAMVGASIQGISFNFQSPPTIEQDVAPEVIVRYTEWS